MNGLGDLRDLSAQHIVETGAERAEKSHGLNAVAEGFRHLCFSSDHEINAAEWIVYDALYAYCQEMVKRGKPDGAFKDAA